MMARKKPSQFSAQCAAAGAAEKAITQYRSQERRRNESG